MKNGDECHPGMGWAIRAIMGVNSAIYLVIAAVLSLLAVISLYDVALRFFVILDGGSMTEGVLAVLHALLVTIIIIEILETVTAYFRTCRLQVRPILIAGLTAMVRKILVYGLEPLDVYDVAGTVAIIAVLSLAVALIGKEK
ncbi:hypothetical protein E2N92_04950 [Methanofollis formosanus]|uniref:Phosphate-starvation-inducible PsiE family protein n=1 Tax=Methanofollis formosanus TaxID=299308 RepID=A0A8G1EFJ2_9EURY|nr:phosphate-starvation-inducible PsiE family protein [Methanofollis formosanus]QYZ78823.1 hypothetical protein E2N92_04950 [Methanofollis formosanus]